jgi:hypothetical protein
VFIMVSEDLIAAEDCWSGMSVAAFCLVMSRDTANRGSVAGEMTCFRS